MWIHYFRKEKQHFFNEDTLNCVYPGLIKYLSMDCRDKDKDLLDIYISKFTTCSYCL